MVEPKDPTSSALNGPAKAAIDNLAADLIVNINKIAKEHNLDTERVLEALNLSTPTFIHRLRRFKPTAWHIALSHMASEAPAEVRKRLGEKKFDGGYVKWVSENWGDRKEEFEAIAQETDIKIRVTSEREGARGLIHDLRKHVSPRPCQLSTYFC